MTPDQLEQMQRARALQLHCKELAIQRMWAVTTEALGMTKGWDAERLHDWMAYNENMVVLMRSTRKLLPF